MEGDWLQSLPDDAYSILQQLKPSGAINVKADMNRNSKAECPEFSIAVDCLGTSLTIPKFHYPIDNVFGTVVVKKDRIALNDIRANGLSDPQGREKVILNGTVFTEDDQIKKMARLIAEVDARIPMTILAFFPEYKMKDTKSPTLDDMIRVFRNVKEIGLKNIKLGNCGVFAKSHKDWEYLLQEVGKGGIG